jgi:DNA-binding response OmpR family regulator
MQVTRVLVVEDDPGIQALLTVLLTREGLVSDVVGNGAEAITRLCVAEYDLIVLDLMLPVRNGFDVLRHLSAVNPKLLRSTIVLTAVSDATLRGLELQKEIFALVRKPFDLYEFLTAVRSCVAAQSRKASRRAEHQPSPPE